MGVFGGRYGDGFVVDDADGFVEDVVGEMAESFPDGFVDGGGRSSFFSFFAEEPEQMISETRVAPGNLQGQVGDALKRVPV